MSWVHDRSLKIVVWTVNDVAELNRLAALGVDGITSANLIATAA